ncbi:MAG: tripartite tricarboxylate transporter substrate binding protein [Pseudomonadota bacterium]
MIKLKSLSSLLAAVAFLVCGASVQAADYPERAINVIVPIPAGSAADGIARIVFPAMEKILGKPMVIENIGGAAHIPGMVRAARQEADGYNVLWATIADFSANPNVYARLPYAPKDFDPVGRAAAQSLIMAVPSSSGINSAKELVAMAKTKSLSFASTGIGNSNHLLGEMLMQNTGIKLRHIPYQGGSEAVLSLMRGEVDVMFYSLSQFQPGLQSNQIKLLGITSEQRSKFLPELPTMREQGYTNVLLSSWYGLFVPAGTPEKYREKLFTTLNQVLSTPAVIEALKKTDTEVWTSKSPKEFEEFLAAERTRYGKLVDDIGLKKQ